MCRVRTPSEAHRESAGRPHNVHPLRVDVGLALRNGPALEEACHRIGWEVVQKGGESKATRTVVWVVSKNDMSSSLLKLQTGQWLSRLPGMHEACGKVALAEVLNGLQPAFWPRTWHLACQSSLEDWLTDSDLSVQGQSWIVKPNDGFQGKGIEVACCQEDLRRILTKQPAAVVQEYIRQPLLLDGRKWDLRLYALILPDVHGQTRCFLAETGIARVCADAYLQPTRQNIHRQTMHLTNYSLNKQSNKNMPNQDPGNAHVGCKRTFLSVLSRLQASQQIQASTEEVWRMLGDLVSATVSAMMDNLARFAFNKASWGGQADVASAAQEKYSSCFQILGLDVLFDDGGKAWLLEVNCNPSFSLDAIRPLSGLKAADHARLGATAPKGTCLLGHPCLCPAHSQAHVHYACPVDMTVKLPVLEGALAILAKAAPDSLQDTADLAHETIYRRL